jgi:hypothetical protein
MMNSAMSAMRRTARLAIMEARDERSATRPSMHSKLERSKVEPKASEQISNVAFEDEDLQVSFEMRDTHRRTDVFARRVE